MDDSPMIEEIFGDSQKFFNWLRVAGHLKVFWLKPVEKIEIIESHRIFRVYWQSRRSKGGIFAFVFTKDFRINELFTSSSDDFDKILIIREDLIDLLDFHLVDAEGILYIWDIGKIDLIEPNKNVDIEVLESWNEDIVQCLENVQKKSWGFFKPPSNHHVVFIAKINGEAIGSAYLNKLNFNIDYGIHVIKDFWRRRIGTRILHEIVNYVKSARGKYLTVVRVFRKVKGTKQDKIATSFYRANNPSHRFRTFRLKK